MQHTETLLLMANQAPLSFGDFRNHNLVHMPQHERMHVHNTLS